MATDVSPQETGQLEPDVVVLVVAPVHVRLLQFAVSIATMRKFLHLLALFSCSYAFTPTPLTVSRLSSPAIPPTQLNVAQDLDVIGLVAGQENYGLAVVCVGEALWSFLQAPSFRHAIVLVPAGLAAVVLGLISGPMITSGNADSVGSGLFIATAVSLGLGVSYVGRLVSKFSPSPKEIAFLGLLVAVAGFFSFTQNLIVDEFVTLPSLPTIDLGIEFPKLELGLGDDIDTENYYSGIK